MNTSTKESSVMRHTSRAPARQYATTELRTGGDQTSGRSSPLPNNPVQIVGAGIGDPPGPTSFSDLLEQFGGQRGNAVAAIRIGFPATLIGDAGQYFEVPLERIVSILRLPAATARTLSRRGALMDASASERLWRLADVMDLAREVFHTEQHAKAWMRAPNRSFHDAAPMDYLDTEPGAIAARQLLNALTASGMR